jgi:hypothetical protein
MLYNCHTGTQGTGVVSDLKQKLNPSDAALVTALFTTLLSQ